MRLRCLTLFAAGAVAAAGCSKGPYETAPVSGRVTLNGKPVEKIAVMFQPVAPKGSMNPGPGSFGITDADGRYSLKVIGTDEPGAVVGMHKVRIEPYTEPGDPSDDRPRKPPKLAVPIPRRYNQMEAILEFDVTPKGSDKADFDLKSP